MQLPTNFCRGTPPHKGDVVESTGSVTYITTATTPELAVVINGRVQISAGETIGLDFLLSAQLHLFDVETEQRL